MKFKMLIAGLLASFAGTSSASFIADGTNQVNGPTPGSVIPAVNSPLDVGGDLFLVVKDETSGNTFVQNLQVDFVNFLTSASLQDQSYNLSIPALAAGGNFFNAGDSYRWSVLAGNNLRADASGILDNASPNVQGLMTTAGASGSGVLSVSQTAANFHPTDLDIGTAVQSQLPSYISGVNAGLQTTDSAVFGPSDATADWSNQSGNLAGAGVYGSNNSNGALGQTTHFFFLSWDYYYNNFAGRAITQQLGDFTLDLAAGKLNFTTAAVPVPAAVWLLGSALFGFATVARRESRS